MSSSLPPGFPYHLRFSAGAEASPGSHALARIVHARTPVVAADNHSITLPLPLLQGTAPVETWISDTPVHRGQEHGVFFSENGEALFGHGRIDDAELDRVGVAPATQRLYASIERLLQQRGYAHCLRTWNFLSRINEGAGDAERYRQFVLGRHQSLALSPGFEARLPAATAIGSSAGGLLVYFLAARNAGTQIENPRQISAFHYPRQHGPRSPSFSRALLKTWGHGSHLYVSGTASVVGHESFHAGAFDLQLIEVLRNVGTLCEQAQHKDLSRPLHPEMIKVYVRHRQDADAAAAGVRARFGATVPLLVLEGEICRRELLLEVEGIFSLS